MPYYFSIKLKESILWLCFYPTGVFAAVFSLVLGRRILGSMLGKGPVILSITTRQTGFDFVPAMRERQATIPQDRSFSLYGTLQKLGVSLSLPDYTKDNTVVFRKLLRSLVTWDASAVRLLADTVVARLQ